ncbi:MAG: sulfurtransferase complex subunit TusD [Pseudomonadota bacterium]
MIFGILVNSGPYQHQAADSAYQFARAILDAGHVLHRVFFYHDGVNNGTRLTSAPQDDRQIVERWTRLALEQGVDLVLCVAAAQRRGVVDADEAERHGKDGDNLAPGFRISGLGQLIETAIETDRLVTFGA